MVDFEGGVSLDETMGCGVERGRGCHYVRGIVGGGAGVFGLRWLARACSDPLQTLARAATLRAASQLGRRNGPMSSGQSSKTAIVSPTIHAPLAARGLADPSVAVLRMVWFVKRSRERAMSDLPIDTNFYATSDVEGEFRNGEIFHIERNSQGGVHGQVILSFLSDLQGPQHIGLRKPLASAMRACLAP
jgi:hypothetical protein